MKNSALISADDYGELVHRQGGTQGLNCHRQRAAAPQRNGHAQEQQAHRQSRAGFRYYRSL